jgi:hypothetical protein
LSFAKLLEVDPIYIGIQYVIGYWHKRSFLTVAQKIFSCISVRKNLFSQDFKKDLFLGSDEVVSDFKNHTKKHNIYHDKVIIDDDKGGCRRQEKSR